MRTPKERAEIEAWFERNVEPRHVRRHFKLTKGQVAGLKMRWQNRKAGYTDKVKHLFPGDMGFEYIEQIQDKEIKSDNDK